MHKDYKTFSERLWIMGDYAEDEFFLYCQAKDIIAVHIGMNRPPYKFFPQLPAVMRAAPDYLCETGETRLLNATHKQPGDRSRNVAPRHFFCEVKGCGKDQTFKIKDEALDALHQWQHFTSRPVLFFLFNKTTSQHSFGLTLDHLTYLLPSLERGYFLDNGKERPFYKLPAIHPDLTWEMQCARDGSLTSTDASSTATPS